MFYLIFLVIGWFFTLAIGALILFARLFIFIAAFIYVVISDWQTQRKVSSTAKQARYSDRR